MKLRHNPSAVPKNLLDSPSAGASSSTDRVANRGAAPEGKPQSRKALPAADSMCATCKKVFKKTNTQTGLRSPDAGKTSIQRPIPKRQTARSAKANRPQTVYYFHQSWQAFVDAKTIDANSYNSAKTYFKEASHSQNIMKDELVLHLAHNPVQKREVEAFLEKTPVLTGLIDSRPNTKEKRGWSEHWDNFLHADAHRVSLWTAHGLQAIYGARLEIRENYTFFLDKLDQWASPTTDPARRLYVYSMKADIRSILEIAEKAGP